MSKVLSNAKVVQVRADSLRIHPEAQRKLLPSKLNKLVKSLNLDAIGVLHGVEYKIGSESAIWIIDGQHRLAAVLEHGFGEWLVEVKVHLDVKDDQKACALFLQLNDRAPVSPFDKFLAAVTAGYPAAVGVRDVAKKFDLKIDRTPSNNAVACVSSLQKIYSLDGGRTLYNTLRVAVGAWGLRPDTYDGKLLLGIGMALAGKNGSIDLTSLQMKLAKYPGGAPGFLGDARGLRKYRNTASMIDCVAERIIEVYNSKKRLAKVAA